MAELLDFGVFSIIDTDSSIGVGWKLNIYVSGTSTRLDTFPTEADALALSNANTNPVVVGADGRLPPMWVNSTAKGILTDENDVVKNTIDPMILARSNIGLFSSITAQTNATGADTIRTSGYSAIGEGAAYYIYDPAVDAAYVTANPRLSFMTSGGRGFRLDPQQRLTIQMFGGKADGTPHISSGPYLGTYGATDNAPALNAALGYLLGNKLTTSAGANKILAASPAIHFPGTDGIYDFQSTIDVRTTVRLLGDSGGNAGGGYASVLRWRPGMHGLVFHQYNSDLSGALANGNYGAGGSLIDGLSLFQHRTSNNFESEDYHGIYARTAITVLNSNSSGWSGAGLYSLGGSPLSNSNGSFVSNCYFYGNEHGIHVDGGDANVWLGQRLDCTANRGYGVWDSSFLGNTWIDAHTDLNGVISTSAQSTIGSTCSDSGNLYYVRKGQASGASTNAPSGTSADNTWWGYISAGAPSSSFPEWVSGTTFREGGPFRTDSIGNARSNFFGCYAEGTQGACYFDYPTMIWGGLINTPIETTGATVINNDTGLTTVSTPLDISVSLRIDGAIVLGPRKTGWATATGTATRTTFDTATVTTAQLAERVKALIDDLHSTAGHGAIGT